ncbi:PIN domain-containing protein [Gloeocapsopsis dulcis]|uniref:DNA-binding protein n=1 Tax=Gloeocapsopsis dulcis AAB1 = 1H9 TaxID=1433147 RepID=A0A6N8G4J7_9CHRO|nr:PIN domain-containing protein [Gloeocapsopsis dulcis]MUL39047.1 DNA-binding protein [Gloeocapsopsis dulcis AAB1 = 1H9]WNN90719.1 PIN domain-containing protein [Gloeocapsopsis dulcis]
MRVLVDTNIILDALSLREPFFVDAKALLKAIESKQVQGYITATTLTDIFYIARKNKGIAVARQDVAELLVLMQVCTVDRSILEAAISSQIPDFEDAIQLACAISENLDAIITRDTQGFAGSELPVLSAGTLLARLSSLQ